MRLIRISLFTDPAVWKAQPLRTLIGYLTGKQFHVNAEVSPEVLLSENTVDKLVDSSSKVTA